ncbi:MAG: YraN family protein [Dehalococcoidaceae bacterium]|nr:YraN family protein [Dehalococcoidaceae bacterium]
MTTRQTGKTGEKIAAEYLLKNGYRILARNYTSRLGEIDIVAEYGNELVVVEVRTKTGASFGLPEESITRSKQRKLITMAEYYRKANPGGPEDYRIDVIAVTLGTGDKVTGIKHIPNAVEQTGFF